MAETQNTQPRGGSDLRRSVEAIVREPGVIPPPHIQVLPLDHDPTDADFAAPVDQQHVVISPSGKLWARIGGVWKSATLT